tara:strand:+ start:3430 stop:4845 length:1416 start_codon:yes stop_codon:yes gene_type:complete
MFLKQTIYTFAVAALSLFLMQACKSDDNGYSDVTDDTDDGGVALPISAQPDAGETFQNASLEIAILSNDQNVPEDAQITLSEPGSGIVSLIDPNNTPGTILDDVASYAPDGSYVGETSFTYTVCDAEGGNCDTGTVTINVLPFSPVNFDINEVPYDTLSEYNFFDGAMADQNPVYGVVPYEPISALFTDYAHKNRYLWMPNGVRASYVSDADVLDFPVGTVLIKSFFYDNVQPANETEILETRLMIRKEEGWIFANYIWNEDQNEAFFNLDGANVPISWIDDDGTSRSTTYRIPSESECFTCHKSFDSNTPIGLKPQSLDKDYPYADGLSNQLQKFIDMGYLEASVPSTINAVVDYTDTSQPIDLRMRSYVDINCASCHSDGGHCDYRSLRFAFNENDTPENMGICVTPDTPIPGQSRIVVPGDIDTSVLYFRINTEAEEYRMPLIGRTLIQDDAVTLVADWINSLSGSCD